MGLLCGLIIFTFLLYLPGTIHSQDQHEGEDHPEQTDSHDHEADMHDMAVDESHEDHEGHDHEAEQDSHAGEGVLEISAEAIEMAGIKLAQVTRGQIGQSIDLPGEVGFNEDRLVHIAPRFAGIAREARYRIGDQVKSGSVVVVVESNESMSPYSIKAPISGTIIDRHVTPGEFVSEENTIYVIADLSQVWVNLAVYPKDAQRITTGLRTYIKAIGSDMRAEGIIDYVTPVLDVNTRSITARVILPNPDNSWRPGTFVQAEVIIDPVGEGLLVNKQAVQILHEETVVFVPDGPGRFKPVDVITGEGDANYIRILSGLEEGHEYVASGAFELKAKLVTSSLGEHAGHGH